MRESPRTSRSNLRHLLASSSLAAILIGGGTPAAYATCSTSITTNQAGCSNSTTITKISISNATITGDVQNTSTGIISPDGITLTNSTITGSILNDGSVGGNITIGTGSAITGTTHTGGNGNTHAGILFDGHNSTFAGTVINHGFIFGNSGGIDITNTMAVFGESSAGGGIVNTGTISASGAGLQAGIAEANVSTFQGGITNSGTLAATATGLAAGIAVVNGVAPSSRRCPIPQPSSAASTIRAKSSSAAPKPPLGSASRGSLPTRAASLTVAQFRSPLRTRSA